MAPTKRKRPSKSHNDGVVSRFPRGQTSRTIDSISATQPSSPPASSPPNKVARDVAMLRTNPALGQHQDQARTGYSSRSSISREESAVRNDRDEVIMAINMTKSTLGCSYFAEQTLFISDDIEMSDMDVVGRFLAQIEPTVLLVSSKIPKPLYSYLDTHQDIRSDGKPDSLLQHMTLTNSIDFNEPRTLLQTLPSVDFLFSTAKDRIVALDSQILSDAQATFSAAAYWDGDQNPAATAMAALRQEAASVKLIRAATQISFENHNSVCI